MPLTARRATLGATNSHARRLAEGESRRRSEYGRLLPGSEVPDRRDVQAANLRQLCWVRKCDTLLGLKSKAKDGPKFEPPRRVAIVMARLVVLVFGLNLASPFRTLESKGSPTDQNVPVC